MTLNKKGTSVTGWNDLAMPTGINIVAGQKYALSFQLGDNTIAVNYSPGVGQCYVADPDYSFPFGPLSAFFNRLNHHAIYCFEYH